VVTQRKSKPYFKSCLSLQFNDQRFGKRIAEPMNFNCWIKRVAPFALLLVMGIASASPTCNVPPENWMKETELKQRLKRMGYLIRSIRIESGCYEIYGLDPRGRRIQILIDPATAKPVVKQ